jgi:ubiquinone/menaquinone biosynthesis C-methylase UbiE
MSVEMTTSPLLAERGIGCLPRAPGNPAEQTSGRTLDHVAGIYDALEPLMMFGLDRVCRRDVLALLALRGHERVLDVGCGTGTLTREMAGSLSDKQRSCVVGVDAASEMIRVARRKAAGIPNVAFEAALAEQLPFADGSFDHAVSTLFFHHINATLKRRALDEIWRTLVPGGKAIVVDVTTPTSLFGAVCAWSGYLLFQQAEIRENIEGRLEQAFEQSRFRRWRRVTRHAGYIAVFELVKSADKNEKGNT